MKKSKFIILVILVSSCKTQEMEKPNSEIHELTPETTVEHTEAEVKYFTTLEMDYVPSTFGEQGKIAQTEGKLFNYLLTNMLTNDAIGYKQKVSIEETMRKIAENLEYITISKSIMREIEFGNLVWDNPYPLPKLKSIRIKGFDIKSLDGLSEWFPDDSEIAISFEDCTIGDFSDLNNIEKLRGVIVENCIIEDYSFLENFTSYHAIGFVEEVPSTITVQSLIDTKKRNSRLNIIYNGTPIEEVTLDNIPILPEDVF